MSGSMEYSRRLVLGTSAAVIGSTLAGCSGRQTGENPRDSAQTSARTTPTCTTVETSFEMPSISKPADLTTKTVELPVARIERAYEDTLMITPELLPGVPEEAELNQYNLRRANIQETSAENFRVEVIGIARFTVRERNGKYVTSTTHTDSQKTSTPQNITVTHHDAPIQVATYRVTARSIRRKSGIGDLTGTLYCW